MSVSCLCSAPDDKLAQLARAEYDAATDRVRLFFVKPLKFGRIQQPTISAATLTDLAGNPLDGNGDGTPGDSFQILFGRGTNFSIRDSQGDVASLKLTKGGVIDLRQPPGAATPSLTLIGATPGVSVLSGKVKKSRTGDGRVSIASLAGTTGVDLTKLVRCSSAVATRCLDIGVLSAAVVDRVLEHLDWGKVGSGLDF